MLVKVNNININYEVCGQGSPIILLHGNQETHEIFDKLIEKMQVNYTVYALDSRCHGKSDNPDKISYNLMAGDTIAFIKKLKISKPILYGFSDGGIVGLLIAIKEPDILSNLIISGANITPDATTKLDTISFIKKLKISKPILYGFSDGGIVGLLIAIKEPDILSNLIISGANITPDATTKLVTILTRLFYFFTKNKLIKMMLDEPNIPLEDLQRITIPVHVLAGEKDVIRLNHTKLIADNIKNSTLEIVKGENHGSYIIHSDKIYGIIKKYLEKI